MVLLSNQMVSPNFISNKIEYKYIGAMLLKQVASEHKTRTKYHILKTVMC
jgi:hypothetical protein